MLPLLRYSAPGTELQFGDAVDALAKEFALTDAELAELLPSGKYPRFRQRVGWAKTYLSKAGLLAYGERGAFRITDRGKALLSAAPSRIDIAYLRRYPEFEQFHTAKGAGRGDELLPTVAVSEQTPRELLESSFLEIRNSLADELLSRVKANTPDFFQRLVVELLVKMGYGGSLADAGSVVGGSGDRGIDGIVKQDVLGLDAVYIQAKRYAETTVGSETVRNFAGSLLQHKASKGVLITTSTFSPEAQRAAESMDKRIVLIDGPLLAELMIDYGVGVVEDRAYVVKRMDSDFFELQ